STANLQFWEVYTFGDIGQSMQNADKALDRYLLAGNKAPDTTAAVIDSLKADTSAGSNPLFRLLNPAVPQQNPETGRYYFYPYIGVAKINDTAKVNEFLRNPVVKNNFPANAKFLWSKQDRDEAGKLNPILFLYAIKTIPGKEGAQLEGEAIEDATQEFDQITNEVNVTMKMTNAGGLVWEKMTEKNKNKSIAIVLDDIVYSAPNVIDKISGGNSRITMGSGSGANTQLVVEEAQDLANILKAGKLNAPAKIVQEQVVGPTLGQEAVQGGLMSFLISFLVIFALMIVYYNTAGIVANIALILNLLFTVGILSAMHATLTAAGIAGLVLTIGMAVDTNVIIFERIKEELAKGSTHDQAVKTGYRRSLPPVLGFATTQILGLVLSLFTGILVSRLITDIYTKKDRHFKYFTS
ncbi:MAG: SecD/SecF family protein translocase subunit, partial [Sphingobacteriales bacterium]